MSAQQRRFTRIPRALGLAAAAVSIALLAAGCTGPALPAPVTPGTASPPLSRIADRPITVWVDADRATIAEAFADGPPRDRGQHRDLRRQRRRYRLVPDQDLARRPGRRRLARRRVVGTGERRQLGRQGAERRSGFRRAARPGRHPKTAGSTATRRARSTRSRSTATSTVPATTWRPSCSGTTRPCSTSSATPSRDLGGLPGARRQACGRAPRLRPRLDRRPVHRRADRTCGPLRRRSTRSTATHLHGRLLGRPHDPHDRPAWTTCSRTAP